MSRRHLTLMLILLTTTALVVLLFRHPLPPRSAYELALAQARQEKKNLLIYFTGEELCPACLILERHVLATPAFQAYQQRHFIYLKIDCRGLLGGKVPPEVRQTSDYLSDHYDIEQIPTLLVLSAEGREIARQALFPPGITPAQVIARLQSSSLR